MCVCVCADDRVLLNILPLADEYQSQHVRIKCEVYVGQVLKNLENTSNKFANRKLLYLLLCEQHSLTDHWDKVLQLCAAVRIRDIENSKHFEKLTPTTQIELLKRQCHYNERHCY